MLSEYQIIFLASDSIVRVECGPRMSIVLSNFKSEY